MLEEAGLGRLLKPASDTPLPPRVTTLIRVGEWFVGMVAFLAALAALLAVYPWLSIQEGSRLDPANPYSQMFTLTNNGYIPVVWLDAICTLTYKTSTGNTQGNQAIFNPFATYLGHDQQVTVPCFKSLGIRNIRIEAGATLDVTIVYSFFPLGNYHRNFRRHQDFRFRSVADTSGQAHWQFL